MLLLLCLSDAVGPFFFGHSFFFSLWLHYILFYIVNRINLFNSHT